MALGFRYVDADPGARRSTGQPRHGMFSETRREPRTRSQAVQMWLEAAQNGWSVDDLLSGERRIM